MYTTCGGLSTRGSGPEREKGDRSNLCEAPSGPFRQIGPVPFFPAGARRGILCPSDDSTDIGRRPSSSRCCATPTIFRVNLLKWQSPLRKIIRASRGAPIIRTSWQPQRNVTRWPDSIYADRWPAPAGTLLGIRGHFIAQAMLGPGGAGVLLSTSLPR